MGREWVLDWEEAAAAGAARCGGKGWNLGRLHRYGFPVPTGAVLTAGAYNRHLSAPALGPLLAAVRDIPATEAAADDAARRLAALREAICAEALPAEARDAVASYLAGAGLENVPLAVRSSATAEDSARASFAGMHQSFLNVVGPAAVCDAIKRCYASLWTPQAVTYRRHLGLADPDVACAVVLCHMVGGPGGVPQAAGVAFSCDPRTGRRDAAVINAVPGLGDALVAGHVNPEEITVGLTHGHLGLEGRKGRTPPTLTDEQAVELARLVLRVHWALGDGQDPQDVEWAYDGRRFWLLQARPVTRLPRLTYPEVKALPVIWSNANLSEVIAGVPGTLTWSSLQAILWDILFAASAAVGHPAPRGMEQVRRFAGRGYLDLGALQWNFYDTFGLLPAEINRTLGGHQPEVPVPPGSAFRGRRGWSRLLANAKLVVHFLRVGRTLPRAIAALHATARSTAAVDLRSLTLAGIYAHMQRTGDLLVTFGFQAQLGNATGGGWYVTLQRLLEWVAPGRGAALASGLVSGSGAVTSAAQGYGLFDLAALARHDPAARGYLARTPLDPHGWRRLPQGSPFRAGFAKFLAEFGHRAVNELELGNPRWNEDPTYLLEQIRHFVDLGGATSPRERARSARAAAEEEVRRHTLLLRPLVGWLARKARHGGALREAAKSAMLAVYEPMRATSLEIGRRLAAAGMLDRAADVAQLCWLDVEAYVLGEWDGRGARSLVADRNTQAAALRMESPPSVLILDHEGQPAELLAGCPAPSQPHPDPSFSGRQLVGLSVSGGRAGGPACLLRHPEEGARLRQGDVLVAPSTDPGWTPLFLRASALVLEVGGILSHGAIVAREYGIPAVTNIPGVLGLVRDGQMLMVDGDIGRVVLGEGPALVSS